MMIVPAVTATSPATRADGIGCSINNPGTNKTMTSLEANLAVSSRPPRTPDRAPHRRAGL